MVLYVRAFLQGPKYSTAPLSKRDPKRYTKSLCVYGSGVKGVPLRVPFGRLVKGFEGSYSGSNCNKVWVLPPYSNSL